MIPRDKEYMHHILENQENKGTIEGLLIKDKINQQAHLDVKIEEMNKLSSKIELIFNTLKSIANNMEENTLEECLHKASEVVMSQISDIAEGDAERMKKLIAFLQENEDEKLSLLKEKEELEEINKEIDDYRNELEENRKNLEEQNEDLLEQNTGMKEHIKEIEDLNKELDAKLLEATEELKSVYDKNPQIEQMEEEIEDLSNTVNNKDQQ